MSVMGKIAYVEFMGNYTWPLGVMGVAALVGFYFPVFPVILAINAIALFYSIMYLVTKSVVVIEEVEEPAKFVETYKKK